MKLKKIPVRLINEPDRPVRSTMVKERLEELAESIDKKARNAPIRMIPSMDDAEKVFNMDEGEFDKWVEDYEGEWLIADGHRRFIARKKEGDQEIYARLDNVDPEQAGFERAKENLYREDVSPVEEGRYFQYLKREYDLTDEEIGKQIGQSRTYVNKRLKAPDFPPEIRNPLEQGDLKWTHALKLKEVDNENHRRRLVNQALTMGATTASVHQWVKNYKKRKKQVEEQQKREERKKEAMSDEQRAEARDHREQQKKYQKEREITQTCSLHGGQVPIENITSIKVCDVCFHTLAEMKGDIQEHLKELDEQMRYKKMEEEMEKEEGPEETLKKLQEGEN